MPTTPPAEHAEGMDENETLAEPHDTAPGGVGTATPPPPSYAPPPYPPPPAARAQLRRSRTDRVLGGVCGGFGRYFDLDPVLLRVLVVVATLFTGGALAVAYVVAWLVIPDDPAWVPIAPGAPAPSYAAGGTGTFVDPATGQVYGAVAPAAPVRTHPRSYLGLLGLSVSVLVGGLLIALAVAGVHIPVAAVAAAMLAVLGVALLVGAFRGRAKWLIIPAVVLLLVAQAASAIPRAVSSSFGDGAGDRRWTPTTLATQSYELGAGDAVLDLSRMPSGTATMTARVSLGTLKVIVPADTTLVLLGRVGLGEVKGVGSPQQGTNITVNQTFAALTGAPSTTVDLTAELGVGSLEVDRATS
jgi:phage shock protein PspC (stress-responsive transcriptional regulator)